MYDAHSPFSQEEKPLDFIINDAGYCSIFRTISCVGDSLSSGEFESVFPDGKRQFHDFYEYSWGQFLARTCGSKVNNFSRGGMTAKEYCDSFADSNDYWNHSLKSQAYIIALGVNDINWGHEIGSADDIDFQDWHNNKQTFAGYYGQIIQRYKEIQPKAHFFLVTIPRSGVSGVDESLLDRHQALLYEFAKLFDNCWVLDIRQFGQAYGEDFQKKFYMGSHMNACGYVYTSKIIISYIDYIIRHNMGSFSEVGFIGTPYSHLME